MLKCQTSVLSSVMISPAQDENIGWARTTKNLLRIKQITAFEVYIYMDQKIQARLWDVTILELRYMTISNPRGI